MAVQLKGKIRGQIQLPRADTQNPDKVLAAAMGHPELHELLASHTVKRVILAPNGRLVSIVI